MEASPLILPIQSSVIRFRFGGRSQAKLPQMPAGRFPFAPAIDLTIRVGERVIVVLRNPVFDQDPDNPPGKIAIEGCAVNFGPDPNDPAWFSLRRGR